LFQFVCFPVKDWSKKRLLNLISAANILKYLTFLCKLYLSFKKEILDGPLLKETLVCKYYLFIISICVSYFNFSNIFGATQWFTQASKSKYQASQSPSFLNSIRFTHDSYFAFGSLQWLIHSFFKPGMESTGSSSPIFLGWCQYRVLEAARWQWCTRKLNF